MSEENVSFTYQQEDAMQAEDRRIRYSELPNGCWVVTRMASELKKTSYCCLIRGGALDEAKAGYPAGTAHFLEHVLFKGDHNLDPHGKAYDKSLGPCSFQTLFPSGYGGHTNYTRTFYTLKNGGDEDWKLLLRLVSEPRFNRQDVECERRRIRCEQARRFADDFLLGGDTYRSFEDSQRLHPVIGDLKSISKTGYRDLLSFHQAFYTSDKLIIAAEGPVHHDQLVEKISRSLTLPRNLHASRPSRPPVYVGDDKRSSKWHLGPGLVSCNLMLPITRMTSNRKALSWAFDKIFNVGSNSPFFMESIFKKGYAYHLEAESCDVFGQERLFQWLISLEPKAYEPFLRDIGQELGAQAASLRTDEGAEKWRRRAQMECASHIEQLGSSVTASTLANRFADSMDAFDCQGMESRPLPESMLSLSCNEIADMIERVRASRPTFRALGAIKGLPAPDQIPLLLNPR